MTDLLLSKYPNMTRQSYIETNWPDGIEWDAELEAELPEKLQDWSLFRLDGDKFVYTGK